MHTIRNLAAIAIISVLMAGCGPIYSVNHTYVPPKSASGKSCVTQCMSAKTSCSQMCEIKNQTCRYDARQQARFEYDSYRQSQERQNLPVTRTLDSFDNSSRCNDDCGCGATFNMCYTTCGGEIVENKVCTAFCDKQ